jgi:hypothetical protein
MVIIIIEFAISEELAKGSYLRDIFLCNLDGDNIMLRTFHTTAVEKASSFIAPSTFYFLRFIMRASQILFDY